MADYDPGVLRARPTRGPGYRGPGPLGGPGICGPAHKQARDFRARPDRWAGVSRPRPSSGPGSFSPAYRWSLPCEEDAARPASSRATGIRNGEQET
jgi:hypothetical protein